MRALSATLLAAQKGSQRTDLVKLVLSNNGTTYTHNIRSGSNRIKFYDHTEVDDRQSAQITLDNSDKTVSGRELRGFKAVLSYGITTSGGDEYSATAPLYVIGDQSHSWSGRGRETGLPVTLSLGGIFNLMNEDEASESYTQESDDTNTVKTLLRRIAGDSGETILTAYTHCQSYDITFDSEDDLIDAFIPADTFTIGFKANRLSKFKELLNYTDCVARIESDGKIHISVPVVTTTTQWQASTAYVVGDTVIPTTPNEVEYKCTTAGTSDSSEPTWPTEVDDTVADNDVVWTVSYDYDYRLESTYHTFFNETFRKRVVIPGYVEVESVPSHDTIYSGNASDSYYSTPPLDLRKRDHYHLRLTSNAQAINIATAILSHHQAAAERGWGEVPMNVGAEVHDFVKVKDTRLGEYRVGNIGYLRRTNVGGPPRMEFRFGKLGTGVAGTSVVSGTGGIFDPRQIQAIINNIYDILNVLRNKINEVWSYLRSLQFTTGLIDTPPSYTGAADKAVVVNSSATGLTFGEAVPNLEDSPHPVFLTAHNVIFSGNAPLTLTDLDTTVDTSANETGVEGSAWVYLKIVAASGTPFLFQKNGAGPNQSGSGIGEATTDNTNTLTYVVMLTDSNGLIEWKSSQSADSTTITLLAYLNTVPASAVNIFDGSLTQTYQVIDTGTKNALCLLRIESNNANGLNSCTVRANWEELNGSGGGPQFCNPSDGKWAYVLVPSDGAGNIQVRNDNVSARAAKIYIDSALGGGEQPRHWLHHGTYEENVWFDIPVPYGASLALIRFEHKSGANSQDPRWRVNGETLTSKENGGGVMWQTGSSGKFSYALVLIQDGAFEFESNEGTADTIYLSAELVIS